MPSVSVRLSRSQIDDLVAMCGLGRSGLNGVADALEHAKPTIKRTELSREISSVVTDERVLAAFLRALPGLATAIRKYNVPSSDLLDSVQSGLHAQNVGDATLRNWHECRPVIERMLASAVVRLYAKARDIAFDFERLYARARILTDIRPVYDDERNVIIGTDITQTLRLDYFTSEQEAKSISVALDTLDVEQLKKCCEDALQKADVARKLIENTGLEVVQPGERLQ
jgi:hypothetical protein